MTMAINFFDSDTVVADRPTDADADAIVDAFARNPSPERFEPLVTYYMGMVRGVVQKIVLSPDDVSDIAQEAFIRAYQRYDTFSGRCRFSTWLCQIAVNQALSHLRREKRRGMHVDMEEVPVMDRPSEQPDHQLANADEWQRVTAAMASLPPTLRAVFVLAVIEELPGDEIATIMKCPRATVYWRLHRARKKLATLLAD